MEREHLAQMTINHLSLQEFETFKAKYPIRANQLTAEPDGSYLVVYGTEPWGAIFQGDLEELFAGQITDK